MSKHLKVLQRAGLIVRSREAQWRPCRLEAAPLKDAADWLEHYRRFWEQSLDRLEEYLAERYGENEVMTIEVTAFRWVPPFAQGYVRDLRVRWALEEAGLPYKAILIDSQIKNSEDYRAWQPFGQVPAYRDNKVELFEIRRNRAAHRGRVRGVGAAG